MKRRPDGRSKETGDAGARAVVKKNDAKRQSKQTEISDQIEDLVPDTSHGSGKPAPSTGPSGEKWFQHRPSSKDSNYSEEFEPS